LLSPVNLQVSACNSFDFRPRTETPLTPIRNRPTTNTKYTTLQTIHTWSIAVLPFRYYDYYTAANITTITGVLLMCSVQIEDRIGDSAAGAWTRQ